MFILSPQGHELTKCRVPWVSETFGKICYVILWSNFRCHLQLNISNVLPTYCTSLLFMIHLRSDVELHFYTSRLNVLSYFCPRTASTNPLCAEENCLLQGCVCVPDVIDQNFVDMFLWRSGWTTALACNLSLFGLAQSEVCSQPMSTETSAPPHSTPLLHVAILIDRLWLFFSWQLFYARWPSWRNHRSRRGLSKAPGEASVDASRPVVINNK